MSADLTVTVHLSFFTAVFDDALFLYLTVALIFDLPFFTAFITAYFRDVFVMPATDFFDDFHLTETIFLIPVVLILSFLVCPFAREAVFASLTDGFFAASPCDDVTFAVPSSRAVDSKAAVIFLNIFFIFFTGARCAVSLHLAKCE
ncbi:MAG: hypothetical protein OSJ68_10570 [Clostridia bacterium]|nr:hypothetical protein [Clostridia bacterium]